VPTKCDRSSISLDAAGVKVAYKIESSSALASQCHGLPPRRRNVRHPSFKVVGAAKGALSVTLDHEIRRVMTKHVSRELCDDDRERY
jgi:hypothetical protein